MSAKMHVCSIGLPSRDSTIAVGVVRALVEAVEDAKVPRAEFLRAARLDPAQLGDVDARVPGSAVYTLCELALDRTGDPAFGLHWAERLHGSVLGPISHLIAHSRTLREGFETLRKFELLLSDVTCHELVESEDTATVRCRFVASTPRMQRFSAEIMMAFFFRLVRDFDRHARPHSVSFQHAAPAYRAEYTRVFEGTERFEQDFTGIVFDRALLGRPAPHCDDDLRDALEVLAERRLLRIAQRTPYSLRIRDVLLRQELPLRTDMATVARALGMSTRSLRRRLVTEGKSYYAIVNEVLASRAKSLLLENRRTIQETAHAMGFSDPRTFHRAFKRWTGTTPTACRKAITQPC